MDSGQISGRFKCQQYSQGMCVLSKLIGRRLDISKLGQKVLAQGVLQDSQAHFTFILVPEAGFCVAIEVSSPPQR